MSSDDNAEARQFRMFEEEQERDVFSEDVTRSLACGINVHVSKPIEPDLLGVALS